MKLAYLSPLPPSRSGVSEYSVDLLPHLARHADVWAYAEPPSHGVIGGAVPVGPPEDFDRASFDLAVYHMGNNLHHRFVAVRAERRPGLLVLHDLVLHHYWIEETLAKGDPWRYIGLMEEAYGEMGREVALSRVHATSDTLEYFVFPLFERLASKSLGVLVHNRRARHLIEERVANVPVAVVPMGVPDPSADPLPEREAARRALGVLPATFLVGLFGFMTPIKRPLESLRAFAAVAPRNPAARLVVVGEVGASIDLAGEARRLGIADRLTLTGYVPYDQVKRWVAAADVFVNLRYPTAGETSASLLRLLGWGKPAIVSDYAQFRELPDDVAIRISLGPSERQELAEVLVLLASRPDLCRALGDAAAHWVRTEHTLEGAARRYAEFARELVAAGPEPRGRIVAAADTRTSRTPHRPRARIEAGPLPARVPPGARLTVRAHVTNTGDTTWLRLWTTLGGYTTFGGFLRRVSDPRKEIWLTPTAIPGDIEPGEEFDVSWSFTAPDAEEEWELVCDVEIMGWGRLRVRGSEAIAYRFTVSSHVDGV